MMNRLGGVVALVIGVILLAGGIARAQDGGLAQAELRLVAITPLPDLEALRGVEFDMRFAVLSPDGAQLAWTAEDGICVLAFASGDVSCHLGGDQPVRVGSALYWSPDSQAIAFHEDALRRLEESDIWLLDLRSGQYANLTDDGITGAILDADDTIHLDTLPVWDPASGDLYFFRGTRTAGGEDINAVYRIRAAGIMRGGEPERVADLSAEFPVLFPVFSLQVESLGGSAAIAPDGTTLAFIARPARDTAAQSAVWLVDLTSGELRRLAWQTDILSAGLPDWYVAEQVATDMLEGLAWLPDSATLVLSSTNPRIAPQSLAPALYTLDAASGAAVGLRDLRDIPDLRSYMTAPVTDEGYPAAWGRQMFGALLPSGDGVIYTSGIVPPADAVAFSAWLFDSGAGADQPVRVATIPKDEFSVLPVYRSSAGASGDTVRILSYGYLLRFERVG